MKKLLALVLLLGFASISSAAFVLDGPLTVAPNSVSVYNVSFTDTNVGILDAAYSASKGGVGAPTLIVAGRDTSFDIAAAGSVSFAMPQGVAIPAATPLFSFQFTAPATTGPLTLQVVSSDANGGSYGLDFNNVTIGTGMLQVDCIPEPMTLSLLALGGLGLIRRRRA